VILFGVPELRMRILIFVRSDPFHRMWIRHELHESHVTHSTWSRKEIWMRILIFSKITTRTMCAQCVANQNTFSLVLMKLEFFFFCVCRKNQNEHHARTRFESCARNNSSCIFRSYLLGVVLYIQIIFVGRYDYVYSDHICWALRLWIVCAQQNLAEFGV